jgi:polyhydroxyalkanoate synthesis regulator phasin
MNGKIILSNDTNFYSWVSPKRDNKQLKEKVKNLEQRVKQLETEIFWQKTQTRDLK